ncbi:LRR receptor-like serine threonine-protein kinase [Seminavis robusta]|uniref:LRR receptor-like serine threonine-protein kinase n=1 Tax=Seminavis robusta TaxID=568900 RepID=A0A9N8HC27_9STRA|nr:LRR receptor-like serine threonine-protein kinase [Seminavis robusta]|eukprot:Sro204_g085920.1 LRR receptor-like serine threonine-protein kinase (1341) ;mRNA; r:45045-49067
MALKRSKEAKPSSPEPSGVYSRQSPSSIPAQGYTPSSLGDSQEMMVRPSPPGSKAVDRHSPPGTKAAKYQLQQPTPRRASPRHNKPPTPHRLRPPGTTPPRRRFDSSGSYEDSPPIDRRETYPPSKRSGRRSSSESPQKHSSKRISSRQASSYYRLDHDDDARQKHSDAPQKKPSSHSRRSPSPRRSSSNSKGISARPVYINKSQRQQKAGVILNLNPAILSQQAGPHSLTYSTSATSGTGHSHDDEKGLRRNSQEHSRSSDLSSNSSGETLSYNYSELTSQTYEGSSNKQPASIAGQETVSVDRVELELMATTSTNNGSTSQITPRRRRSANDRSLVDRLGEVKEEEDEDVESRVTAPSVNEKIELMLRANSTESESDSMQGSQQQKEVDVESQVVIGDNTASAPTTEQPQFKKKRSWLFGLLSHGSGDTNVIEPNSQEDSVDATVSRTGSSERGKGQEEIGNKFMVAPMKLLGFSGQRTQVQPGPAKGDLEANEGNNQDKATPADATPKSRRTLIVVVSCIIALVVLAAAAVVVWKVLETQDQPNLSIEIVDSPPSEEDKETTGTVVPAGEKPDTAFEVPDTTYDVSDTPSESSSNTTSHSVPSVRLEDLPAFTMTAILDDPESAQAKAWAWMQEDPWFNIYSKQRFQQRFSLATLYFSTNGSNWDDNGDWLSYEKHECLWFSKATFFGWSVCDEGNTYNALVLQSNGLQGDLPSEITLMSSLRHLHIGDNQVGGSLPHQLGLDMPQLRTLNLFQNAMSNTIPSTIGVLSLLENMDIQQNKFEGLIPTEIGLLDKLKIADWSKNRFSHSLPKEMGQLTQLKSLLFEWNELTGSIPSTFGNLESLVAFNISNNNVKGMLPSEIGKLTLLEELWAVNNDLHLAIPSEIGLLRNLTTLNLFFNSLDGTVPSEIGMLTKLQFLYLSYNKLSGSIPDLSNMQSLQHLFLNSNQLSGSIPPSIGNLTTMEAINLNANRFSGAIPPEISSLSLLTQMDLDDNGFESALPTEIGLLQNLLALSCNFNDIVELPSEIGALGKLTKLSLKSNSLRSTLPHEIGWLTNLEALILVDNMITGSLPSQIGLMSSLQVLDVSSNALSGEVPSEAGLLPSLHSVYLELNMLESSLPTEIGLLTNLENLVAWENQLSGQLPTEIGLLTRGDIFDLSHNRNIHGTIPVELGEMKKATEISFSVTSVSGSIPPELGSLSRLETLRLDSTFLTGPIPNEVATLPNLDLFTIANTMISGNVNSMLCGLERFTMSCSEILCGCDCPCGVVVDETESSSSNSSNVLMNKNITASSLLDGEGASNQTMADSTSDWNDSAEAMPGKDDFVSVYEADEDDDLS